MTLLTVWNNCIKHCYYQLDLLLIAEYYFIKVFYMGVFLIRKIETLIFSLLENIFLNRSFDEKQEIAKRGKCYEKPC